MNHPIVAADANDLVQETAAKDAAGWLTRMTRTRFSDARELGTADLIRDKTCRAGACDVPGTWAEVHHLDPWHTGGRTDLDWGVLLCSHQTGPAQVSRSRCSSPSSPT